MKNKQRSHLILIICLLIFIMTGGTGNTVSGSEEKTVKGTPQHQLDVVRGAQSGAADQGQGIPREDAIFLVMGAVMIIWLGISIYLFMIDRKISKLGKKLR